MNKTVSRIVVILIIAAAITLIFILPKLDNNQGSSETTDSERASMSNGEATGGDKPQLIIGDANAPKTIIEYGDYKCPTCAQFHRGSYVELKRDYLDAGKAKIVFRNLPYIADDSRVAAEGTYCANEQNLFEQYHDAIYDYTSELYEREGLSREFDNVLAKDLLADFIANAGGDRQQFSSCLDDRKYETKVDNDLELAERDQAAGTPTFLIDGQKIVGAQPITIFRTLLER
jgi:protein-disulfide isomerase